MSDCITARERPCLFVGDDDIGYLVLTGELQPDETVTAATATDEGGGLTISNPGPNAATLLINNVDVPPGKAAQFAFRYDTPPTVTTITTVKVQVTTSLSRIKTYRCPLEFVP